jgi:Cdc6-like AAA superfamily ATPase
MTMSQEQARDELMKFVSDLRVPYRLNHPSNILLVGATQSGKTEFVYRLVLNHAELFRRRMDTLTIYYREYQTVYARVREFIEGHGGKFKMVLTDTYPTVEELTKGRREEDFNFVIIDDLLAVLNTAKANVSNLNDLYVRGTHHKGITVVTILQDIFANSTVVVARRNSQYVVLMNSPSSMSSYRRYLLEATAGDKPLVDKLLHTLSHPYKHLVVNNTQESDKRLRYAFNVFEMPEYVVPKLA